MDTIKGLNHVDLRYTVKYSAVQCFYWAAFCSSVNFASLFLLSKNFTNSQIGVVLAMGNVVAVGLQPAMASMADTSGRISIKGITELLIAAAGFLAVVRLVASAHFFVLSVLFVFELTILFTLQPFLNSLGMQLINSGRNVNFGLARGMGSMSFAVCSVVLGILAERFGTNVLPAVSFGLFLALGFLIHTFPRPKEEYYAAEGESRNEPKTSFLTFISQNRKFAVLMIAVSLTFCSHTMINNYCIQITENVGGTAKDMGIAIGLAAAVELPAMILCDYLVKRVRCGVILKISLACFVVKTAATMLATSVWMLYAAQVLQFCSYAFFIPASIYYVNELIQEKDLAKGQAFVTSAITFGGVLASLLGGWLLDASGVYSMLFVGTVAAALGLLIGLFSTETVSVKNPQNG